MLDLSAVKIGDALVQPITAGKLPADDIGGGSSDSIFKRISAEGEKLKNDDGVSSTIELVLTSDHTFYLTRQILLAAQMAEITEVILYFDDPRCHTPLAAALPLLVGLSKDSEYPRGHLLAIEFAKESFFADTISWPRNIEAVTSHAGIIDNRKSFTYVSEDISRFILNASNTANSVDQVGFRVRDLSLRWRQILPVLCALQKSPGYRQLLAKRSWFERALLGPAPWFPTSLTTAVASHGVILWNIIL